MKNGNFCYNAALISKCSQSIAGAMTQSSALIC